MVAVLQQLWRIPHHQRKVDLVCLPGQCPAAPETTAQSVLPASQQPGVWLADGRSPVALAAAQELDRAGRDLVAGPVLTVVSLPDSGLHVGHELAKMTHFQSLARPVRLLLGVFGL